MKALLLTLLAAAVAAAAPTAGQFKAGDVVCYAGDSITHGGTYHSIVTLFYATRFPDRPIKYWNCGIGGDRAVAIMSDEKFRLNVDILGHKPTAATIMLGMNDVGRGDYAKGAGGPAVEQKRQASLDIYNANMVKLADALKKSGARLTFITPSIYEESATLNMPRLADNNVGVNAALGECARQVRKMAADYGAGVVDFWGAMNEVNAREQKRDPLFTIVGADRVHPGPVGHFVMAYTMLKAQGMPREVAEIVVKGKKAGASKNARVDGVKKSEAGVEFDALEGALPVVVPEAAQPALELVPFAAEMNQELVVVTNLKRGKYGVRIDGEAIGEFTDGELKAGVNIAGNAAAPQYKQSAEATRINTERTRAAARLRDLAAQKYGMSRAGVDVNDAGVLLAEVRRRMGAAANKQDGAYGRLRLLEEDAAEPGKFERQYEELESALAKACQPRRHHYVVARVP